MGKTKERNFGNANEPCWLEKREMRLAERKYSTFSHEKKDLGNSFNW